MATEGNIYKRRLFVCCPALEHVVPGGGPAYSRQRMAPHDARTKRCPTSPLHLTEGGELLPRTGEVVSAVCGRGSYKL